MVLIDRIVFNLRHRVVDELPAATAILGMYTIQTAISYIRLMIDERIICDFVCSICAVGILYNSN